jgi:hypothetical protein
MAGGVPTNSPLITNMDRALQVKILCELRVHSILMAQAFGITDDIGALRDEVMAQAQSSISDV